MELDGPTIRNGLVDAGLSEYQASAYLTVLEQGTTKAVDVARLASIPAPRIYDVVEELEDQGYVETLERDTLHVRANEPVRVIEDLHERSERLSNVASAIEERWERRPRSEYGVDVYKRADTAIEHAETLVREATTSVELAVSEAELGRFEQALAAVDDDVLVRLSIHRSGDDDGPFDDGVVTDAATEIRDRAYAAPLVANVDATSSCFAPTTLTPDPFGMILNGSHVTVVFHWFFQTCLWSPWPACYRSETTRRTYASLPEFISAVYDEWHAGTTVTVSIDGVDTATGERTVVEGTLADVQFTGLDRPHNSPTLADLTGEAAIVVATDDGEVSVGGWGAKIEDVEARRIEMQRRLATA